MNIYWKSIAAVGLVAVSFISGCQYKASEDKKEQLAVEAKYQSELLQKTKQLNEEHESIRQTYEKEQKQAEKTIADLKSRIANGSLRLSVRTKDVSGDTAAGHRETRAELDPTDANDLIAIAADGDNAIRQLNQCIDQYSAVKEAIK